MSAGRRCHVFLSSPPVPGLCPACSGVMDDSGCRFVTSLAMPHGSAGRELLGIERVVEVVCCGTPRGAVYTEASLQAEARAALEELRREGEEDGGDDARPEA